MSDRDLLMIPGPIAFDPAVLRAMSAPTLSHVSPEFIEVFGQALSDTRSVFLAPDGQPCQLRQVLSDASHLHTAFEHHRQSTHRRPRQKPTVPARKERQVE